MRVKKDKGEFHKASQMSGKEQNFLDKKVVQCKREHSHRCIIYKEVHYRSVRNTHTHTHQMHDLDSLLYETHVWQVTCRHQSIHRVP